MEGRWQGGCHAGPDPASMDPRVKPEDDKLEQPACPRDMPVSPSDKPVSLSDWLRRKRATWL